MLEFGVTAFTSISAQSPTKLPLLGSKPCFCIVGPEFTTNPVYEMAANLFVDFFRGRIVKDVCLAGLDHVIALTVGEGGKILFRHYVIHMKKSGTRVPRVELEVIGPSIDFEIRRHQFAEESLRKQTLKQPKELTNKKKKNVMTTTMKETVANIHVPKQKVEQIEKHAVKPKALRRATKRKRESTTPTSTSTPPLTDGAEASETENPLKKARTT